jgi:hypothetical protein
MAILRRTKVSLQTIKVPLSGSFVGPLFMARLSETMIQIAMFPHSYKTDQ